MLTTNGARRVRRQLLSTVPVTLMLPGTLGVDTGVGSNGVLIGSQTLQAVTAFALDYGAGPGTFTDETAAAASAGANDMHLFPAVPAENDAYYFGNAAMFNEIALTVGTAIADGIMTTAWEYSKASTWGTLTPAYEETAALQPSGTGVKRMIFVPPSDWAAVAVNSSTKYWVRARISAFTSITTVPLGTKAQIADFTHGTGWKASFAGVLDRIQWMASTNSGTTADSVFLIINLTKGTFDTFTMTKGVSIGEDTSLNLPVAEGDQIVVKQIDEDGSTEFAAVQLTLHFTAT